MATTVRTLGGQKMAKNSHVSARQSRRADSIRAGRTMAFCVFRPKKQGEPLAIFFLALGVPRTRGDSAPARRGGSRSHTQHRRTANLDAERLSHAGRRCIVESHARGRECGRRRVTGSAARCGGDPHACRGMSAWGGGRRKPPFGPRTWGQWLARGLGTTVGHL